MSRWHRDNPELFEQGEEPWDGMLEQADHIRKERRENPEYEQVSNEGCRVCGEISTAGGVPCKRCEASMEEDRLNRA